MSHVPQPSLEKLVIEVAALKRLILACNNTSLPGGRFLLKVARHPVGWVGAATAKSLAQTGGILRKRVVVVPDLSVLNACVNEMSCTGAIRYRDEPFDVRSDVDGEVVGQIDRSAMPVFGLLGQNVHLNGLVLSDEGIKVWMGLRASTKIIGPGKWDHITAGGVSAGLTPDHALRKEAYEEAGLKETEISKAEQKSIIKFMRESEEGLRRETIYCFDVILSRDFRPTPVDGEVDRFELWPIRRIKDLLVSDDFFLWDTNLALIDLLIRVDEMPECDTTEIATLLYSSENGLKITI